MAPARRRCKVRWDWDWGIARKDAPVWSAHRVRGGGDEGEELAAAALTGLPGPPGLSGGTGYMEIFIKLLSGRVLTLELEQGSATTGKEVLELVEALDESLVAADHWLLAGQGPGTRILPSATLAEAEVHRQADLRLVPRQRPPPHPAQQRMDSSMAQLETMRRALARGWDELHDSIAALEAKRRAAAERHSGGGKTKDRLKLTVGGETITTKRSVVCAAFPGSKLEALFDGRYDSALLRDPKDKKRILIDWNAFCFRTMIKVCEDRLQRSATEEPLQMPEVPEELEAMMRATFHLFGLDDQKQQQQEQEQEDPGRISGLMEAVPPEQGREPEPEPMDGQAEAAAMSGQATTKEWERAPISELCGSFEAATIAARTALAEATAAHEAAARQFEAEQLWVKQFMASSSTTASRDVVQIDLSGEKICVRRETLLYYKDSRLAHVFAARPAERAGGQPDAKSESDSDSDSDSDEADIVALEHSPYAFKILVDWLRLQAAARADDPPCAPPVVPAHARADFEKLVELYFPGNEELVLGSAAAARVAGPVVVGTPSRVVAFGGNDDGALGDGSQTDRHSPVEIASLGADNAMLAAGGVHSLVLKKDGGC